MHLASLFLYGNWSVFLFYTCQYFSSSLNLTNTLLYLNLLKDTLLLSYYHPFKC